MRDFFLRACVAIGAGAALITELLSPFHLLNRWPIVVAWILFLAAFAIWSVRPRFHPIAWRPIETVLGVVSAAIVAVVAFTAWVSPPNSADAMAYHMPRVVYWAQAGSVAFFPTPYLNQISLQPLTEYLYLHTYLISGGDHFINLITCAVFLASIIGVSAIARALELSSRGQAFAALVCATIPNGILQASGAKNDWMLAFWLICAVYFAARQNGPFAGCSLGLALATKATAYLFAPPVLVAVLLIARTPIRWRTLAWFAAGIFLMNGPQYFRNVRLSGSPLGFDSAQGDGVFRWRNDRLGLKATASNFIRHTSEQLGDRRARWNQAVFDEAVKLHHVLGIDPNDPATTWPYAEFTPPRNANHEADGNSHWHLLLMAVATLAALISRKRSWILYSAGLFAAFVAFCFYLRWQPFMVRLELPLLALGAPLAAAFLESLRPWLLALLICLFLAENARLPLLQNWTRPLRGHDSLLATPRDMNYFRDMVQWDNRASYVPAVDLTARSSCHTVGIDITQNQLEYPFQALLRERDPAVQFVHTGVENASVRYAPANPPKPCAVLCLDCAGLPRKTEAYSPFGPPVTLGRFLLFLPGYHEGIP